MTVRANKPAFNIREKLKELDYSHVPYDKMPLGSCIGSAFYHSSNTGVDNYTIDVGNSNNGYVIDPTFTYYKRDPNSILYVEFQFSIGDPEGYWRENILFDHTQENAYTVDTIITNGGADAQANSSDNSLVESQKAVGVISGYVVGANASSGVTSGDNHYIARNRSGFIHHSSNFVSICMTIGTDSGNTLLIRDDRYYSPKAYVMEFLQ
jgi:hypothetical protein